MADQSQDPSRGGNYPGETTEWALLSPQFASHRFPAAQIVGYGLSLALTAVSFGLVMLKVWPARAVLAAILILAAMQALVQLSIFMHLRESRGSAWHLLAIAMALFIAIGLVALSLWIMMFKWGVS